MTLERKHLKVFGSEADPLLIGQFGSAVENVKKNTSDIEEIQALESWDKGWESATVSDNRYPAIQERNGVDKVLSYQTAYILQEGIPEWNSKTEYSSKSLVKGLDGNNIKLYRSKQEGNTGHLTSESDWWEELSFGGSGLEICDIGMALYIDETKGLRRRLNGQLVVISTNEQEFLTRLKKIRATYPQLFDTEENWQAEKLLSAYGQVGKFVIADDESTVRIPAVVNIQGLLDLQNLGLRVDAGLPNIDGRLGYGKANDFPDNTISGALKDGGLDSYTTYTFSEQYTSNSVYLDASLSNPIYGNSDTVQPEAIQYPYFIQIATGQETKAEIINELELNNPYTLFDCKYSETKLYNIAWLRSEGQWNSKATYPKAYEALLVEQNAEIADGETVELPSGTSYTKRGVSGGISAKLSTESYTDEDFVVNTSDETFRLAIKSKLASSKFAKGNGMTVGFTDGYSNGGIVNSSAQTAIVTGVYGQNVGTTGSGIPFGENLSCGLTTDSSKSGIELDDSNLYLYYYVGETVQNHGLINAGRIEEKLVDINSRPYITETYVSKDGTSWYRVWSDGWCEQGGIKIGGSSYGIATVSLIKPYLDETYWLNITRVGLVESWFTSTSYSDQRGISDVSGVVNEKYNDRFKIQLVNIHLWKAEGYIS